MKDACRKTSTPYPSWLSETPKGTLIRLYIQPKASRSEISGQYGEGPAARLKIRITAPPVDGAANDMVIRVLKEITGIPQSRIQMIRGASSRSKDFFFEGFTIADITARLRIVGLKQPTGEEL